MSEIIFEEYPEYEEKKGQPVPAEEDVWRPAKNRLNELLGRSPLGQEVMAYGEHIIKVNDLFDDKLKLIRLVIFLIIVLLIVYALSNARH